MPGNVRYASYGANNSNAPSRTKSLDCLADKNDKTNEYIPSRITRMAPKANETAMQFVKTGPANLYKTATEQIKKAEAVKAMRKHLIAEEEEWQEQPSFSSSSSSKSPYDEDTDWQSNLDKWKSSRRKRNEEALERVIEIKKNEQEEEFSRTRRKSKTFSEMREDKTKRGRRYNLVVHDDDNNDLADLGLSSAKSTSSLNDPHEENDVKDLDQDNKDAKSDAGFCTGSDTGSDGVFAEDNISDTSSALGDKKEAHDSLLDSGLTKDDEPHLNGHSSGLTTDILQANTTSIISSDEYTYDKAIEGYKQYAENSAKRRTSSITSLNSNTSYTKDDERKDEKFRVNNRSPSPVKNNKLEDKLNYFSREMENQFRSSPEPKVIMREKSPKVDICKRRSMFEMNVSVSVQCTKEQKQVHRRSLDVSNSLRNKVASFENLETESPRARSITPNRDTSLKSKVASFENLEVQTPKVRGITPPRDTKFHEKLATFTSSEIESQPVHKKTPERDVNFHKKLASFTSIENGEEDKVRERKTIPARDPMLKNKIASFEQLEQAAEVSKPAPVEVSQKSRERSVSLENLDEPQVKEVNAQVFEIASKLEETPLVGSPVLKAPTLPLPVPPTQEEDSLETSKPYTDDDINEVISDYEQVGGSYEDSSDHAENIYENITDEPMYENIYEKVNDESNSNSESEPLNEPHHYQTLEEVREEVKATAAEEVKAPPSPEPPAPMPQAPVEEPPVVEAPEVLDVTWTDGPSSQAAPPSEPPPPPPPDDDSDEDASDQLQSLPAQEEDAAFTRENSTRRIKKEIWRRRSDFLGTSSQYIEEEPTVKPPPDLSEFLRKEREVDRVLLESQQSKISNKEVLNEEEINRREREIIESLERSEQLQKEQQQSKYIWEDPEHQSDVTAEDMSDADEHLQYQMDLQSTGEICTSTPQSLGEAITLTQPSTSSPESLPQPDIENKANIPQAQVEFSMPDTPRTSVSSQPPPMHVPEVLTPTENTCKISAEPKQHLKASHTSQPSNISIGNKTNSSFIVDGSTNMYLCNVTLKQSCSEFTNVGIQLNRIDGQPKYSSISPIKKVTKAKTVRFNIADNTSFDESDSESSHDLSSNVDPEPDVLNPQNSSLANTYISDGSQVEQSENNTITTVSANMTSSALFPSQAQNQQTSSESNMDMEVAMMVPEASPNIPESSHSVSETTDSEPKQMEFDNVESNPPTTFSSLKSTVNTEESQVEVLEKHVVEAQSVKEVAKDPALETDSQSQAETECKLIPESSDPDHLVAHCGTLDYSSDSIASTGSLPEQYKKLAELEEEMMRHDKDMLQRAGKLTSSAPASQSGHIPPPSLYASQEEASPNASIEEGSFNYPAKPTSLPLQEFYTAPTFGGLSPPTTLPLDGSAVDVSSGQMVVSSPSGSPSQYSTLASPHPFNRSHSQNSIGGAPIHAPLQGVRSSPMSTQRDPAPEPLPRKKKLPPPPPTKPHSSDLNTVERLEAIRLSRMPTSDVSVGSPDQPETQGPSVSPSGQQMSKQTLLALSAIPKPRLTDNESWITKKKPEARRDYSKHWLHQEAEQRRLEQQDRINRYKTAVSQPQLPASQPTPPHCASPQHPSPSQTTFHPSQTTFIPQNTAPTYSSYPQSLKNPSLSQVNNGNNNNNNNNNSWRNQATTYQPPMPAPTPTSDKALPDSIIHNLTQRVNNKNNKNTYNNNNNNNGRLGNSYGNNYRDENYHDYMNADALSSPSSHAPLYQSGTGPGQPSPPSTQPDPPNAQDQRLLSVSGKKKCSHCSEELGRGAAMIIESLRLFYHIPCFKCCVCGIQLGNGSAGADVRVRNHKLHCHNCYSNDEGMKFSKV